MENEKRFFKLISLGEPLMRLSPPHFGQLRRADSLDVYVVGSQLNVAANLARLGEKTAFITQLPSGPLGLLAMDVLGSYGVDTSFIKFLKGGKMGVTYVEFSASPRTPIAIYDRAQSAASQIKPKDFNWNDILSKTVYAYTDGIFPGLSSSCYDTTLEYLTAAKLNGCKICFDINYREHLWDASKACDAFIKILPSVDILATNRDVSELVFHYQGSDDEILKKYKKDFNLEMVCLTSREIISAHHGAWKSKALYRDTTVEGKRYEFEIVDRYGTGDAWFAGLLYGMHEKDVNFALNFANALCALAHTVHGDIAHVTPDEVISIMGDSIDMRIKR
jgi:2-dehydro-3-deoxygluconokinase